MASHNAIIIDHDGGVDDMIAAMLQMLHDPHAIKAITIVPADCFDHPAVWVTHQLKNHFLPLHLNVPIGVSPHEGINPFPDMWREDAWTMARLPMWHHEENLQSLSIPQIPSAKTILADALRMSAVPVKILETGPCSNIAEVLHAHPELKDKIERIFIMGGALYVDGNVRENGHDGSAEWNIYNNPHAFKEVLLSGIPITLIALDATQYTPISKEFIAQVAQCINQKQFQFVHESLKTIQPFIESGQYLFWDTLTSATLINPQIVKTKKIAINVITEGPSMGRTIEDANGFVVDVALWADQALFEKTVLDILSGTLKRAS
jgi:purine nucleosidase